MIHLICELKINKEPIRELLYPFQGCSRRLFPCRIWKSFSLSMRLTEFLVDLIACKTLVNIKIGFSRFFNRPVNMASNWTAEEDEEPQLPTESNPADYVQLWKKALDVNDEVQRIVLEHEVNVDSPPDGHPTEEDHKVIE